MKKNVLLISVLALLFACNEQVEKVKLSDIAKMSEEYVTKVQKFESSIDMTNVNAMMAMNDSIDVQKRLADTALTDLYKRINDTLYLPFEQTENKGKIQILNVWVAGAKYDELVIQAQVKALDNSSLKGPYTSLSVFNSEKQNVGVGGGIGGSPEEKLVAGETYIFEGKIDNLHKLQDVRLVKFDEDIKKW